MGHIEAPIHFIRFEDVCFSYPNSEKEVLHDANFEIDLSQSPAIVGRKTVLEKQRLLNCYVDFIDRQKDVS